MKKLFYFSTTTFPNSRAHSIQIMNMCNAFSDHVAVTLFAGYLKDTPEAIFERYNLSPRFKMIELGPTWRGYLHVLSQFFFAWNAYKQIQAEKPDYVYVREPALGYFLTFFTKDFFFELHTLYGPKRFFVKRLVKRCRGIISTNRYKKDWMIREWGVQREDVLIAHNAVNVANINKVTKPKKELRSELDLPQGKKLIGHIGRLTMKGLDKGIDEVLTIANGLPDQTAFCLVGGTHQEVKDINERARSMNLGDRVVARGYVPQGEVHKYMKAMDYLLLMYPPVNEHLLYFTSPLKTYEYMASGVPVIASDLPSIQEILDETTSFFFKAGSLSSLEEVIQKSLNDPQGSEERGARAAEAAQEYAWDKRISKIFKFMNA